MLDKQPIHIHDARTHNLKGVNCSIPPESLTIVTGVSGSGKSTLAFETLFAEGQRRYVESLSAYARQFLQKMKRPEVEKIENLPPAIAIEQRNRVRNARSTVGTVTEVHDYLRLLFAKVGEIRCPTCQIPVRRNTPGQVADDVLERLPKARALVFVPVTEDQKRAVRERYLREGYRRVLVRVAPDHYEALELEDEAVLDIPWVGIVIDRLVLEPAGRTRIIEAFEAGILRAAGKLHLYYPDAANAARFETYHTTLTCRQCERVFQPPRPVEFSFNSPLGACPECQGFGRIVGVEQERVIPDRTLTLRDGAIDPFTKPAYQDCQKDLQAACAKHQIPMNRPWNKLTPAERKIVWDGKDKWYGVKGFFKWLEGKRYKTHVRVFLARYRGYTTCPLCKGERLRADSLHVTIGGKSINQVSNLPVMDLEAWFQQIPWNNEQQRIAGPVLREVRSRLRYLVDVGLGYLTLARQARTLSGGEAQRIALATALGSSLTDTLYVLDEPSVGLHPRDSQRLIKILFQLRNLGNTLVVVEHDPQIIEQADHVIDMGPEAGHEGGEVIFEGNLQELLNSQKSLTARYLRGRQVSHGAVHRRKPKGWIEIRGATVHNLRDLDVDIPLGVQGVVTGVSGAGKSSLIQNILFSAYQKEMGQAPQFEIGSYRSIGGMEQIREIILMDQEPLGRSLRSNMATYMGFYSAIREAFARTTTAKHLGLGPGAFSFNVAGGRCETCQGAGEITLEMQFLEDVIVPCEACGGKRFSPKVLAVEYRGCNILNVLEMTVFQALGFFGDHKEIAGKLQIVMDVGLGYIRLGQATSTFSGGEAQRLKLASYLGENTSGGALFIFDEPTTGLHLHDLEKLLATFDRLVEKGHSVLVIEHNLDLIAASDYVLDLGPEGGHLGGKLVAKGTPEQIQEHLDSYTGKYLRLRAAPARPEFAALP